MRTEFIQALSVSISAWAFVLLASPSGAVQEQKDEPWEIELDLRPFGGASGRYGPYRYNLVPVLAGEKVLVSSTLALYAVDASSGELAWRAGPPRGWDELTKKAQENLFVGIAYEQLLVAPAAGANVALAALQIPWEKGGKETWQGIQIMTAIPERRLFAFDLTTGAELWNHAPPLDWDGVKGTLAQQLAVAGSPVVAGSCVLVPCYRRQEDIEYSVTCYELETGALLWSTSVTHGQRELNMFGGPKEEFAAPPVVVEGDRVIAQTELGCVAALDLATGRLLWQSAYRQIELPKTREYNTPERKAFWRPSPPVVSEELVLCTPIDSPEFLAFRLDDGQQLWACESKTLQHVDRGTWALEFNSLLGADHDTVYLTGAKVSALRKADGLASGSPWKALWTLPLDKTEVSERTPRALLTSDSVLVPRPNEYIVLDRKDGKQRCSISIREPGNALVTDGALFLLSRERLSRFAR